MLDVLGFGLLIPVGPKLVQQLRGGGEAEAAGAVGLLAATYATMQFLFAPLLGALSDRFGRRPVILFALLGSGIDYFALALAPNLTILYITRAINGLTGASMTAANAYVADVTSPEKRAAGFGMIGAAFGLGFVLGPLIGGWLGEYNIRWPFYAAGMLTLLNWLYGLLVLPESLPQERRSHLSLARANPVAVLGKAGLGRHPLVAGLAASAFLVNVANFGLHATWVLYTGHRFGWSPKQVGLSLFAVGMGAALVQGGLARKVIPWLGERRSLVVGLGLAVVTFILYGLVPEGWMIYPAIAVGSLAGIGQPAAQALITKAVRPYEQGAVQGAMTGLQSIAAIIGPLIGTSVFAYSISERAPVKVPGAAFFVAAALVALGWVVAAWAVNKHGDETLPATAAADGAVAAGEAMAAETLEAAGPG
jgi:DHA1 family tetracycline resistance protein-like MFS transporter